MGTPARRVSGDDAVESGATHDPAVRGYEIVHGQPVPVMPVSPRHGRIASKIDRLIGAYLEAGGGPGEVYVDAGYVLGLARDPARRRAPDLSYVSRATLNRHGGEPETGFFHFAPDLAVEIDSPGRRPAMEQERIQDYMDAGVRLLWVIHTSTRSATVYRPDGSARVARAHEALEGEEVLPGLRLELATLFG
jgi:Uma2 family endonuclease